MENCKIWQNFLGIERVSGRAHLPTCRIRLTFGYMYGGRGGSSTLTYIENKSEKKEKKLKINQKKSRYMSVCVGKGDRYAYLSPPVGSVSSCNHWCSYGHVLCLMANWISLMIPNTYGADLSFSPENVIIRYKMTGKVFFSESVNGLEAHKLKECLSWH